MDQTENKYPEILADLVDKLTEQLQGEGLMAHQAKTIAWNVAEKIRKDWGGLDIYIPKGISYDVDQRDLEIYEQFTGSNHTDLARKHGLSERQIYNVVKRVRAVDFAKKQMGLFG